MASLSSLPYQTFWEFHPPFKRGGDETMEKLIIAALLSRLCQQKRYYWIAALMSLSNVPEECLNS